MKCRICGQRITSKQGRAYTMARRKNGSLYYIYWHTAHPDTLVDAWIDKNTPKECQICASVARKALRAMDKAEARYVSAKLDYESAATDWHNAADKLRREQS